MAPGTSRLLLQTTPQALPRINLIGSGDVRGLGLGPELQPYVRLYLGLSYEEYYDTMCK
jgi:hypothetical protein